MAAYGFHTGMDYAQYAAIPAINFSSLRHMARSPLHYRYHVDNPSPQTDAQKLGSAAHAVMLEPDTIGDFVVWGSRPQKKVRNGKVWDNFQLRHAGAKILTTAEHEYLVGIVMAIRRSKLAMKYIGAAGESEISAVWRDKAVTRDCKGRMDRIVHIDGKPYVVDLKTCRDCQPWRFGNEAHRLGYHMQLALYQDGYYHLRGELPAMIEIAVENKPPHEIAVFSVPTDVLQQGKDDYMRLVQRLTECERLNQWPPALETETELTLPSYAYGDDADDLSDLELIA